MKTDAMILIYNFKEDERTRQILRYLNIAGISCKTVPVSSAYTGYAALEFVEASWRVVEGAYVDAQKMILKKRGCTSAQSLSFFEYEYVFQI